MAAQSIIRTESASGASYRNQCTAPTKNVHLQRHSAEGNHFKRVFRSKYVPLEPRGADDNDVGAADHRSGAGHGHACAY